MRQIAQVDGGRFMNVFRFTFDGPLIRRTVREPEDIEKFDALVARVIDAP